MIQDNHLQKPYIMILCPGLGQTKESVMMPIIPTQCFDQTYYRVSLENFIHGRYAEMNNNFLVAVWKQLTLLPGFTF